MDLDGVYDKSRVGRSDSRAFFYHLVIFAVLNWDKPIDTGEVFLHQRMGGLQYMTACRKINTREPKGTYLEREVKCSFYRIFEWIPAAQTLNFIYKTKLNIVYWA